MIGRYANNWLFAFMLGLSINVLLFLFAGDSDWPIFFLVNLVFFGLLSLLTFWWVAKALVNQSGDKVVLFVLTSLLVDMAGGIGFIFGAVKGLSVDAFTFFIPFGIYYLGFSLLKVLSLLRLSQQIQAD